MSSFSPLAAGALLAALAVALGAFGAHAMKARLDPAMLANFETGARYLMYGALALLALGGRGAAAVQPLGPILLLAGALVFSVSLFVLALTGIRVLGAVTPIGGVLMIAGFGLVALDALRARG